ncbi:MAG: AMP-binding protein [Oscillospiraceae bacterium]|nr:AMP-binding protein [Candidatus Limimonas egerieequi]
MTGNKEQQQIFEVVQRIKEMRDICGFSVEQMAEKTEVSTEQYELYETGTVDLPFTFVHKCALAFNIGLADLLEGQSARLSTYTVTRRNGGLTTAREDGITIQNLAPLFKDKLADPYFCVYEYDESLQDKPIKLVEHAGHEFNFVIKGSLRVQVGDHIETLHSGDSIYFKSSIPHGELAVDGAPCKFLSIILNSDVTEELYKEQSIVRAKQSEKLQVEKFITTVDAENGAPVSISFRDEDKFNFAFDVVDEIARNKPEKVAMIHLDRDKNEVKYTFRDMKDLSSQAANYFTSLGIKKGDRVMLVLKRRFEFWVAILGLHKIGAIAIPATHQLKDHDFEYRFNAAGVKAIVCTCDDNTPDAVDAVMNAPTLEHKLIVGADREGWKRFDEEYKLFSRRYLRTADSACGDDPMIMFFTSGTSGYPKMALHSCKYPLGHFHTAKYWHCVRSNGVHLTISDTGWGKALWGKLYGQWMYEGAIFVYDFDRFNAADILPLFAQYGITTFCAPPTMYRMLIKEDLSKYDLSSIEHATIAGEALNPEVFYQFKKATGLELMEGFGQTETTLTIANLVGMSPKPGSMGKPVPVYDIALLDADGKEVGVGENGEICINTKNGVPCGLFLGYYKDKELTKEVWHDGYYHTGDIAWKDEDGYFWYVSRIDDVIKSSGYRIGPFEIENVIMELPYVLECGVSAAPDEVRGQVVKASIVLVPGTEPTDELKKEIQNYVKQKTAPYKYPRIVEFKDELPKTISGKIIRKEL